MSRRDEKPPTRPAAAGLRGLAGAKSPPMGRKPAQPPPREAIGGFFRALGKLGEGRSPRGGEGAR